MSLALDEALVRSLLAAQFPELAGQSVRQVIPRGWDNRTFRIGSVLLARLPSAARYADQVERERDALRRLAMAGLPTPIPRLVRSGRPGCGYPYPWSIYAWLPGTPLADLRLRASPALGAELAEFLKNLRRAPVDGAPSAGPANFHRGGDLRVFDRQVRRAAAALAAPVGSEILRIWELALDSASTAAPVWVHGDFAPRNILVDDHGDLAGVIDFGQAAAGDPACDLAIAWTYLEGAGREVFRAHCNLDRGAWARAKGWAAWKAAILASGVAPGPRPDVAAAAAVLRTLIEARD